MGLSSRDAVEPGLSPARGVPASRSGFRRGFALAAAALLVGALVCAIHWPVLHTRALSIDDAEFVTKNPLVRTPGWPSVGRFFGEVLNPSTVRGYYLPLSMTSLMLDYAMGGRPGDPRVFHRTSLALHALNTILILLILYRLFGALVPATLTALLFGLHPLTVEPTAWIGERKTLLATCFALASILGYLQHARGKGRGWIGASVGLFVLALLSKPTVTLLPVLLLMLDRWPLRRLGRAAVIEKWPFYLVSLASGVITLISHQRTAGLGGADYAGLPLRAGYLLEFYLWKMVWPGDLSCVYPQPAPFAISNPAVLLGLAVTSLVALLLIWTAKRHPGPLTGWLFFVVAIAPTLGLVQYSWIIASDKYAYFPALGILMVIGYGLTAAWSSSRLSGLGSRALLLLALSLVLATEARGARTTLRNWTEQT